MSWAATLLNVLKLNLSFKTQVKECVIIDAALGFWLPRDVLDEEQWDQVWRCLQSACCQRTVGMLAFLLSLLVVPPGCFLAIQHIVAGIENVPQ